MRSGDPLEHLARAVADGSQPDWASGPSAVDAGDLSALAELRLIEEIARLHRSATGSADAAAPAEALFEWGSLRVVERVGVGAFGEVFRAWDTVLEREVALKLLRPAPSAGSRSPASVVREGQMLARVRHPNVVAIYGAQQIDGRVGIWCEFLRGRTLASIVEQDGPLSAAETAAYADPICSALSAVHRAGLLHRDIKAQNVIRECGGRIVLMDFGLGRDVHLPELLPKPELAGTPLYMAPELFRGERASARTDVYSVGVLLFYLVTGRFPVEGETIADIAQAHSRADRARLQDLRSDLPASFVRVIERALDPEPAARFESAGALQAALAPSRSEGSGPIRSWKVMVATTVAVMAVAAALVAGAALTRWRARAAPVVAFTLSAPEGATFAHGSRNVPVISPDGRYVAFIATSGGVSELWLRDLADQTPRRLNGTAGAFAPFWSADSQAVWFVAGGALQRVTVTGARSESIPMSHEHAGAAWNRENVLLIARDASSGLTASAHGKGPARQVTTVNRAAGEETHAWPQFLPDGRQFLFYVGGKESVKGAYVGSLDGRTPRRLIVTDASAVYASGHLLYARDGALFAQPFEPRSATLSGQPVRLRNQIAATWESLLLVSASENDRLVFATRESTDNRQLSWRSLSGRPLGVAGGPERLANPSLSPDGRYIAVQTQDESQRSLVRIFNTVLGGWTEDASPFEGENPIWTPDGRIIYSLVRGGLLEVAAIRPFRDARPAVVVSSQADKQNKQVTDVSRDGTLLAYTAYRLTGTSGNYDLWIADLDGRPIRAIARSDNHEISGRFSPDAQWLAFATNQPASGVSRPPDGPPPMHVYIQRLEGGAPLRVSSEPGGYDPLWASDSTLLYIDPYGWLNRVELTGGVPAAAERLFQTTVWSPGSSRNHYDVARDGSRLIMTLPLPGAFSVLTEWRGLLAR